MSNKDLFSLLTVDNAKIAAQEIVSELVEKGTEENIEIDYQMSMGIATSESKSNTIFKFNFSENGILHEISKAAIALEQISNEQHDALLNFEQMIITEINKNHFDAVKDKLRNFTPLDHAKMSQINPITRNKILEIIFPMKDSKIESCYLNFLFRPDQDDGYTLMIKKNSPKRGLSTTAVSNDLIKRHTETGDTFEKIIEDRKKAGDEQYKYVVSAKKQYYEFQCQASFSINYTPAPKEEVDEAIKDIL